jgi:hypothetical protein
LFYILIIAYETHSEILCIDKRNHSSQWLSDKPFRQETNNVRAINSISFSWRLLVERLGHSYPGDCRHCLKEQLTK